MLNLGINVSFSNKILLVTLHFSKDPGRKAILNCFSVQLQFTKTHLLVDPVIKELNANYT
jgi:hypothetical protein